MGISANVEISRTDRTIQFSSLEEALDDQREVLHLKEEKQIAVLKKYLRKTLQYENGQYLMKMQSSQAKIWWEKEG